jgi:4-diphosphocytidyl-2-C-methyl-D-erythritol kinase
MVAVSLYDTLTFRSEPSGTVVRCTDDQVGAMDDNLVTKAIRLVREQSGREDGLAVDLDKRIPVAAGLAGGSSDAAATLSALNHLWDLQWSQQTLVQIATRLGSDVAFFFHTPAAIARGRGEKVTPRRLGAPLHAVLISPSEGLSTAQVYARLRIPDNPVPIDPIVGALENGDVEQVARLLFNRLEEASVPLSPAVASLKAQAESWNCAGHLMSGSGSTYFALCSSAEQARQLGDLLRPAELGRVFVVHSSH